MQNLKLADFSGSFFAGCFFGAMFGFTVPVRHLVETKQIEMADYVSFLGSIIGAAGGVAAAFLAVYLSHRFADKRDLKTLRELLADFDPIASTMYEIAHMDPVRGVSPALVHYRATRDAALGMRTRGAKAAKVAARLETDQVAFELDRLNKAGPGAVGADIQARAEEMRQVGRELLTTLDNGL